MVTICVHRGGRTTAADRLDPAWLDEGRGVVVWADLVNPTANEAQILSDVFHVHRLAVEDALPPSHHPTIEAYDGFVYMILHGFDFQASRHEFATHNAGFFVGPVPIVRFLEGEGAQFWWILGIMGLFSVAMLGCFRRKRWL